VTTWLLITQITLTIAESQFKILSNYIDDETTTIVIYTIIAAQSIFKIVYIVDSEFDIVLIFITLSFKSSAFSCATLLL